ncbi:MAG: hypothetical protein ABFD64_12725 [Armatimonadota bacterium]
MTDLFLHSRKLETIFDLLGKNENDITYSLGWVMSRSKSFLSCMMEDIFPGFDFGPAEKVNLQDYNPKDGGYTDVEIFTEKTHVIIEAKRGWNLPSKEQLEKYAEKFICKIGCENALVVASECSANYAEPRLKQIVEGFPVPVMHRSWKEIILLAEKSAGTGNHVEKWLLREFSKYLGMLIKMQDQTSNMVYVVAVQVNKAKWSSILPIDYVEKKGCYFHPYGECGWPKEPPNYIAFRYRGQLHSIHHVESYEIVPSLSELVPEVNIEDKPYALYQLGPAIRPMRVVKTGKIYASGRVWASLDLLLTCGTISEARDKTQERLKQG